MKFAAALFAAVTLSACDVTQAAQPASGSAPPHESRSLQCELSVVQAGRFDGGHFVGTSSQGGIVLTVVASAADAQAGRAVMIEGDRAVVGTFVVQPHQTLFFDSTTKDDNAILTIFTGAQANAEIPAAYNRSMLFGRTPIISQYAGLCRRT